MNILGTEVGEGNLAVDFEGSYAEFDLERWIDETAREIASLRSCGRRSIKRRYSNVVDSRKVAKALVAALL